MKTITELQPATRKLNWYSVTSMGIYVDKDAKDSYGFWKVQI